MFSFGTRGKTLLFVVSDEVFDLLGELANRSLCLEEIRQVSTMSTVERAWCLDLIKNDPLRAECLTLTWFGREILAKYQATPKPPPKRTGELVEFVLTCVAKDFNVVYRELEGT
jgi:hypothetical protein